ncbi:hypothetical protein LPW26_06555 [Rhodopseudomonas sp. HC1]|uniref:hypothetical protein n=1 Tax=Rhodopseudomonas infernalis TaxID=2897386 RepID=UPI001EE93715|nr:hypothetical protein [Rhodopseudomonas infernalis]MCG6204289.1 hypothetical protein [Rhodopseudomonas infernalis]
MLWALLAILVVAGVAAVVNDGVYSGNLFETDLVVRTAVLMALALFIGRGLFRRGTSTNWLKHGAIWLAIALGIALLYRWSN